MRPGSPVRSPAQQVKMAQYLWDSSSKLASAELTVPRSASTPAKVWVALATYTKAIQVNNLPATAPISGRDAIFARPQTTVEQVNTAEVVGVCATQAEAEAAVNLHRSQHGQLQAEYTVTEHQVGAPEEPQAAPAPTASLCVGGCGTALSDGTSFCQRCREKQWANSGWRPTSKDE